MMLVEGVLFYVVGNWAAMTNGIAGIPGVLLMSRVDSLMLLTSLWYAPWCDAD